MTEHREHHRHPVAVRGELEYEGDVLAARTQNLSSGGVAVEIRRAIPEDATVGVTLFLTQDGFEDPDESPLTTRAAVRWSAESDEHGAHMVGLQFGSLNAAQRSTLDRFLSAVAEPESQ